MNLERKVALQARSIRQLTEENTSLKEEIEELKAQLELEKSIPKEGYEKTKELMESTAKTKAEYEKLIEECKEIKEKYQNEMTILLEQKNKHRKKIDSLLKKFKLLAV